MTETVKRWLSDFRANLKRQLFSFPQMAASVGKSIAMIFQARDDRGTAGFLLLFAASLLISFCAEWLFKRSTLGMRDQIRQARPEALMESLKVLSTRAGIEIGGVILFTLVALVAASLLITSEDNYFLASTFTLTVILIPRITGSVMHFVLAPRRPELRLVYTDSWNARFIERNLVLIAALVGAGFFVSAIMARFGISHLDTLRFWLGLALPP